MAIGTAVAQMENLRDVREMWERAGPSFTCTEAEAIYTLLLACGLEEHAEAFMVAHAFGDEEEDKHAPILNDGGWPIAWMYREETDDD